MRFKIDWAILVVGSKFTVFALFYFVFKANFPSTSPWGAYIWRGDLTECFLRYRFGGGLYLERLIHGGAYFRDFTVSFIPSESRRDLVIISLEIAFISCRSQKYHKSRRVLDEISARSHLSRRDLRDITNLAEVLARSRRDLVCLAAISETLQISPSSRRDFVNLDEITFISARSRRDL